MNQLRAITLSGNAARTSTMIRSTLLWLTLSAMALGQQPNAASPPVTNSTTLLVIGLDAGLSKSELASNSMLLKNASPDTSAYISFDAPFGKRHSIGRAVVKASKEIESARATHEDGLTVITKEPSKSYLGGDPPTTSQTRRMRAAEASIQHYPIRCLIVPPEYVSDTFEQALPVLPESIGSLPTRTLTQGVRWAALGLNPETQALEATIQSASPEAARGLKAAFPKLLVGLSQMKDRALAEFLTLISRDATMRVIENQVHVTYEEMSADNRSAATSQLMGMLLGAERRGYTRDKLRQIQLAILNYESANSCFPPSENLRGDNGTSGLSWRVHILPYFGGEEAKLYGEFRLNEPWDSPHNKQLLAKMPDCYRSSDTWLQPESDGSNTVFVSPVGGNTVLGTDSVVRFKDVTDGSSRTLCVVEVDAKSAVPWTAPQDYQYDKTRPAANLAFSKDGISFGAACDGSIHELKKEWDAEKYLRLFQRDDGQPVRW